MGASKNIGLAEQKNNFHFFLCFAKCRLLKNMANREKKNYILS